VTANQIPIAEGRTLNADLMLDQGQRLLIQGTSGAGKSDKLRLILEGLPSAFQQVIFDVEDEMHVLRSATRPYAIMGGEYADAPGLEHMDPGELAIAILRMGTNVIFQINDWDVPRQAEFIAAYLRGLMRAPRQLWRPVVIVLDEAHRYAPQKGSSPSLDAIYLYQSGGRKRLFSALLATPRFSDLSASVRSLCNNKLIGRVDSTLDRTTSAEALGLAPSSAEAKALDSLKNGQFWVMGPLFGQKGLVQLHQAKTRAPKAGVGTPPAAAPAALVKALAALPKTAPPTAPEDTGSDGDKGRVRIEKVVDQEAIDKARAEGEAAGKAIGRAVGSAETFDNIMRILQEWRDVQDAGGSPDAPVLLERSASPPHPSRPPAVPKAKAPARAGGTKVTAERVREALSWLHSIGAPAPSRAALASIVEASPTDRSFTGAVADLYAQDVIRFAPPDRVELVDPSVPAPAGPGRARLQLIRQGLSPLHRSMFDTLLSSPGLTRAELLQAIGRSVGGKEYRIVDRLVAMGLVTADGSRLSIAQWIQEGART
jgi:uncharacterized protein